MMKVDNLPVVIFDYPDSVTRQMRQRFVSLTFMDYKYVMGYEKNFTITDDNCFKENHVFKKYRRDRISTNGVVLVRFNSENFS